MALKRLGLVDLISAVQNRVEAETELRCYDYVEKDAPSPFYHVEPVETRPNHTKTTYRDVFTVWVHAISQPSDSREEIYQLIQGLEEALTVDIDLPVGFTLVGQLGNGLQSLYQEETGEWHAVVGYEFTVAYGFKCKN